MTNFVEKLKKIRRRFDEASTNYLRQTTTDQELLNFYGDGKIIGRKGIPNNRGDLIDQSYYAPNNRPYVERVLPKSESLLSGLSGEQKNLIDINSAISPETGRPYQLEFGALPFPVEGQKTAAAQYFLNDFQVPQNQSVDYGFEISPNVEDVKAKNINEIIDRPDSYTEVNYKRTDKLSPSALKEIEDIQKRTSGITRFSGQLATPETWKEQGFKIPAGLTKDTTLDIFKNQILKAEKPFASVSQLTPVQEMPDKVRPGGDFNWRANLYEKAGLAGPLTEVSINTPYGPQTDSVQMFTRGNERLLPIQPYTEFLDKNSASTPSALGTRPAPDFNAFQKAIGTKNYLLGKNLLQGRGRSGGAVRGVLAGVPLEVIDPDVAHSLGKGDYLNATGKTIQNLVTGTVVSGGLGYAAPALMSHPLTMLAGTAYGLTQIPEAFTAFRAGKNKMTVKEQKEKDRNEDINAYKKAFGNISERYRTLRP